MKKIFFIFILFLIPSLVFGAESSLFTDDFETYVLDTDLNGQTGGTPAGTWQGASALRSWQVDNDVVLEGNLAISCKYNSGNVGCRSWRGQFGGLTWATLTFWLKAQKTDETGISNFSINFCEDNNCASGASTYWTFYQGKIWFEGNINTGINYPLNQWFLVIVDLNAQYSKSRIKISGTDWSNWYTSPSAFVQIASAKFSADIYEGTTSYYADHCSSSQQYATGVNIPSWAEYAGQHAITSGSVNALGLVLNEIAETLQPFLTTISNVFDAELATTAGQSFGSAIPLIRGYLSTFDDFFDNWPISEFVLLAFLTSATIIIYNKVRDLLQLIRG